MNEPFKIEIQLEKVGTNPPDNPKAIAYALSLICLGLLYIIKILRENR